MSAANASLGTAAAAAAAVCRAAAAFAAAWAEALRIRVARAFLAGWGRLVASARGLKSRAAGHQTSSAASWTRKKACAKATLGLSTAKPCQARLEGMQGVIALGISDSIRLKHTKHHLQAQSAPPGSARTRPRHL